MKKKQRKNPNTGTLEGMRCPECGSYGPFNIECTVVMCASDDGDVQIEGDTEWTCHSWCACRECEHEGTVEQFTEGAL